MHRLNPLRRDEGSALVPVIGIAAILFIVAMLVASLTASSLATTTATRAELRANAAAEAGAAEALEALRTGCSAAASSGESGTAADPYYRYVVLTGSGGVWQRGCPASVGAPARVVSTGYATAAGYTSGDGTSHSVMIELEAGEDATPIMEAGPSLYSFGNMSLGGSGKILSATAGEPADVQVLNGNAVCDGGTFSPGTQNWIINDGDFTATGSCKISGDVWVSGNATINGAAQIGGRLVAQNITVTGSTTAQQGIYARGDLNMTAWGQTVSADIAVQGVATMRGVTLDGDLTVQGSGLTATQQVRINGSTRIGGHLNDSQSEFNGAVTVVHDATFTGATQLVGDLSVGRVLDIQGWNGSYRGDITVTGDAQIRNGAAVTGAVTVGGDLQFAQSAVTGNVTVHRAVTLPGNSSITGSLTAMSDSSGTAKERTSGAYTVPYSGTLPEIPSVTVPAVTIPAGPVVDSWVNVAYDADDWTGAEFTEHIMSGECSTASLKTAIESTSGPLLIDARSCWNGIEVGGSTQITLRNDVAIFAKRISLGGSGGFLSAGEATVYLVNEDSVAEAPGNETASCNGQSLAIGGDFRFGDAVTASIYTPCALTLSEIKKFTGQVYANGVTVSGQTEFVYDYAPLPAMGEADDGDETPGGTVPGTATDRTVASYVDTDQSVRSYGVGP